MDKKYDALDWQSFSQKKDIEEIVKNTKDRNIIQFISTVEICLAIFSLLANSLFKDAVPRWFSVTVIIISILALFFPFYPSISRYIKRNLPGGDSPNAKSMVDLFDNDICYYVLMAESYSDKIGKIDKSNVTNVDQFYFIETCFYINKAIYDLSLTSNCPNLYSVQVEDLFLNKRISYTRLKNIFNILDNCIKQINCYKDIISEIDIDKNYIELCEKYKTEYDRFKKTLWDVDPSLKER